MSVTEYVVVDVCTRQGQNLIIIAFSQLHFLKRNKIVWLARPSLPYHATDAYWNGLASQTRTKQDTCLICTLDDVILILNIVSTHNM